MHEIVIPKSIFQNEKNMLKKAAGITVKTNMKKKY